jgi:hypothetical protein
MLLLLIGSEPFHTTFWAPTLGVYTENVKEGFRWL